MKNESASLDTVLSYHRQSKHSFKRFADALGYLDWQNQPDPFRRYQGAQVLPLSQDACMESPAYERIYHGGAVPPEPMNSHTMAHLFRFSLGLSAWKQAGDSRWSLRVNPSSGNLHPTEAYLLCGALDKLCDHPMVCHYAPKEHALEKRCELPQELWDQLTVGFGKPVAFIGLTSIHWREAWKYGERAYRYCQLDVGHAIASVCLSASSLGWQCQLVDGLSHQQLGNLLGLAGHHHAETEQPDCLLVISCTEPAYAIGSLPDVSVERFRTLHWIGTPNQLSREQIRWPLMEEVASACEKPATHSRAIVSAENTDTDIFTKSIPGNPEILAFELFLQRRSAVAMDGEETMLEDIFFTLLSRLLPQRMQWPYAALVQPPKVQLLLFVHKVRGLTPGIYILLRNQQCKEELQRCMKESFTWTKPEDCPSALPLYQLVEGDTRQLAKQLSCQQDIAADGCFCVSMLAQFKDNVILQPWFYPQLFWECGLIGQVLYLEAESQGLRGTGIGCFFDDPLHELIGLTDDRYQALYHFTIGRPLEDSRLITLLAYDADHRLR